MANLHNLDPTRLNPSARPIGTGGVKTNLTIKEENKAMAKVIGGGNISAGVDLAIEAAGAVERFNDKIKSVATEQLRSLGFAVESLPQMPHHVLGTQSTKRKALDASLVRWLIQLELDRRNAGEISHSWTAMYLAMGIPKEFLDD